MLKLSPYIISNLHRIEVLVLACSASGFNILFDMLSMLPEQLPIGILVVIHRNAMYETNIESTMAQKCRVTVKVAEEREIIRPATVYFAPAGYHLLAEPNRSLSVDHSEPVNFCRPSIDVTMQSTTDVCGASTAGVLLSGANQDGALGMQAIWKAGGLSIVQDPREAEVSIMPQAAIALDAVDLTFTNDELVEFGSILNRYLSNNHAWKN